MKVFYFIFPLTVCFLSVWKPALEETIRRCGSEVLMQSIYFSEGEYLISGTRFELLFKQMVSENAFCETPSLKFGFAYHYDGIPCGKEQGNEIYILVKANPETLSLHFRIGGSE